MYPSATAAVYISRKIIYIYSTCYVVIMTFKKIQKKDIIYKKNTRIYIYNFDVISGMISGSKSGMISGMIPGMILYQLYLWVHVTEMMAFNVERIASCLGSAIKTFTLSLDTSHRQTGWAVL